MSIRKRPLFANEIYYGEIDAVSMANPHVIVHEPRLKVDGLSKEVNNQVFTFDNAYADNESSRTVYEYQLKRLLPNLFDRGIVTCFAYA